MSEEVNDQPAHSIEALDLHLRYMRRDMKTVLEQIRNMATQTDVQNLGRRIDALEQRVEKHPPETPFWRAVTNITRLGAAIAVVVAAVGAFVTAVHFWDRVDDVTKSVK